MIVKSEKRLCDVCGAEMDKFAPKGSLKLNYDGKDYMGNSFPLAIIRNDICDKCIDGLVSVVEDFLETAKEHKNE